MERSEVEKKVKDILVDKLGLEENEVQDASQSITDDLGADSLDHVELIMECEKEFNVAVDDNEAEKVKTINDMVDLFHSKIK